MAVATNIYLDRARMDYEPQAFGPTLSLDLIQSDGTTVILWGTADEFRSLMMGLASLTGTPLNMSVGESPRLIDPDLEQYGGLSPLAHFLAYERNKAAG